MIRKTDIVVKKSYHDLYEYILKNIKKYPNMTIEDLGNLAFRKLENENNELLFINFSHGLPYHSQRNNKNKPNSSCNVTSFIMAMRYTNPDFIHELKNIGQYEDQFYQFINEDEEIDRIYNEDEEFKWAKNQGIPKEQLHVLLSKACNKFQNTVKTKIKVNMDLENLALEIVQSYTPLVVSGQFDYKTKSGNITKLSHIVTIVGGIFEVPKAKAIIPPENLRHMIKTKGFFIDDPYGNPNTLYKSHKGNDIYLTFEKCKDIFVRNFAHCFRLDFNYYSSGKKNE